MLELFLLSNVYRHHKRFTTSVATQEKVFRRISRHRQSGFIGFDFMWSFLKKITHPRCMILNLWLRLAMHLRINKRKNHSHGIFSTQSITCIFSHLMGTMLIKVKIFGERLGKNSPMLLFLLIVCLCRWESGICNKIQIKIRNEWWKRCLNSIDDHVLLRVINY